LHIPTADLFRPLIPVQIVGLTFVFAVAYLLGRREERRLLLRAAVPAIAPVEQRVDEQLALRRPERFSINVLLTVGLIAVMVSGLVDPAVVFMVGTAVALVVNYPGSNLQRARVDAHAQPAMMMAAMLLAAGAFGAS